MKTREKKPGAKNPEGVALKMRAGRYFLKRMAECAAAGDDEPFLYYLGAFLSAFRTVADRLCGVVGKSAAKGLKEELRNHPDISFLRRSTDVDLHGDGPVVSPRYFIFTADFLSLLDDEFTLALKDGTEAEPAGEIIRDGWQFAERPQQDIIVLCHDALDALEDFVRRNTPSTQ